jgi:hypothetical protein
MILGKYIWIIGLLLEVWRQVGLNRLTGQQLKII